MAHKNKTNVSPFKTRKAAQGKSYGPATATSPGKVHPGQRRQGIGKAPVPRQETANQAGTPLKNSARGTHRRADVIFELEEANDRLFDIFRNHGFQDFPHKERRQLAQFYRLLMERQNQVNMTRLLTLKDVGLKHFIDCLMIPRLTELKFPLMDVGTGPGFPGIPLKILFPKDPIILAEGVQKRVEFLKDVRDELQLENLPIIGRNINQWFYYPVNGVITRAVEDVGNTLRNVRYSLQTGGRVYFMKGPNVDPEIELASKEFADHYKLVQDTAYELPNSGLPRRLVVFEKTKAFDWQDPELEPWPGEIEGIFDAGDRSHGGL